MGPTVIDTNPATVSSSSFLTTGIWTKLQGKERFSYLSFHSLGSGLADLSFFLLISKEVCLPGTNCFLNSGMYLSYYFFPKLN